MLSLRFGELRVCRSLSPAANHALSCCVARWVLQQAAVVMRACAYASRQGSGCAHARLRCVCVGGGGGGFTKVLEHSHALTGDPWGTILNRDTYDSHKKKKLSISLFLRSIFGPIYYDPHSSTRKLDIPDELWSKTRVGHRHVVLFRKFEAWP